MPNYDYHCSNCGYTEEISQRMSDAPITKCPNCGKETFIRAITGGAGVLYKGEGWYVTDYSKKSSGGKEKDSASVPAASASSSSGPEKTTPPAAKPETKSETSQKSSS
jgi:putative FmdB family regulatory protein